MFDRVVAFGDSFVSGDELSQELLPDLEEAVKSFWGEKSKISILGDLQHTDKNIPYDHWKRWRSEILEKYDPKAEQAKHMSYAGQLASHYNAEYYNFSYAGYSMSGIYASVINNRHLITPDSLVIIGITFSDRITRFLPHHMECEPGRNFSKNKNHERYIELDIEYGNDIITRLLTVQSIIESIKNVVGSQHIIFVDPVNIYRENNDITDFKYFTVNRVVQNYVSMNTVDDSDVENILHTHSKVIDYLTDYFNNELFPYTFAHSINKLIQQNKKVKCVLGHPSYEVHKDFTENYLIPELQKYYS